MPQRICSKKAPLLKGNEKRVSKKNLRLNGSNNNLNNVKLSTPANNISKLKQSECINDKRQVPSKKMQNTESGRSKASQNQTDQKNLNGNDNHHSSVGK